MIDLDRVFDRSGTVRPPPPAMLAREWAALLFDHPPPPDPAAFPPGGGHSVLVIPAFLTGDVITAPLRRFLDRCGYRARGWGLGVNWGPTPEAVAGLRRRLSDLRAVAGGPVSLIGFSMGGLMARYLAAERPADVRMVITLGSPFRLPTASSIEPLVRLFAPRFSAEIDPARLADPLPVPAVAIYTMDDGIVAWESCADPGGGVAVPGAHVTLCRNPHALAAVARALGGAAE